MMKMMVCVGDQCIFTFNLRSWEKQYFISMQITRQKDLKKKASESFYCFLVFLVTLYMHQLYFKVWYLVACNIYGINYQINLKNNRLLFAPWYIYIPLIYDAWPAYFDINVSTHFLLGKFNDAMSRQPRKSLFFWNDNIEENGCLANVHMYIHVPSDELK